jgi:hypothetical protein
MRSFDAEESGGLRIPHFWQQEAAARDKAPRETPFIREVGAEGKR